MVSTRPSEPMTMPEPSRSVPRFWTVRPSGLMKALMRTTAAARSSIVVAGWAWAATGLMSSARAAISAAHAPRAVGRAIVGQEYDMRAPMGMRVRSGQRLASPQLYVPSPPFATTETGSWLPRAHMPTPWAYSLGRPS